MRIPPDTIEDIRSSADILEIVSGYVTMKKRGQNHFGLCPFHTEKTPSFSVNIQKQIFHCFGCGEGGNVISFIMKVESLSFVEALQFLAQKLNITIPEVRVDDAKHKEKLALYDVTKFAAKFYQDQLSGDTGKEALGYLNERGFGEEVLRLFEIGYAPEGWDNLIKAALGFGFTNEQLKAVGLIAPNDRGGYYDRFRERIMFPIHNISGSVVGFGGRTLKSEPDTPKYINSPETAIYRKSRILFGLFENLDAIRKNEGAILVEGYADVLGLVQAGIQNVVASAGTALTTEQARLLLRYTPNASILYDGDLAGANAALRGVDVLLHEGLQVRVAQLPEGMDPDSFVQAEGAEAVKMHLNESRELIDFKIHAFTASKPIDTPQRRAELVYLLAESVAEIQDEVTRNLYIQEIARQLNVDETVVFRAVAKKRRGVKKPTSVEPVREKAPNAQAHAERDLLAILLRFANMIPAVYENMDVDELADKNHRVILSQIFEQYVNTGRVNPQHVLDYVEDPEMQKFIVNSMMEEGEIRPDALRRWLSDCLRLIKIGTIQKDIQAAREAIRQHAQDAAKLKQWNKKYQNLKKQEMEIRRKEFIALDKD